MKILYLNSCFLISEKEDIEFLKKRYIGFFTKNKYQIDIYEAIFLMEKYNSIRILNKVNEIITIEELLKKIDYNYYVVFRDLKDKGYVVKSGMKYGFPFRIYEKGIKIGEDHSKWLVLPLNYSEKIKIIDLIAKARVANSVKKGVIFAFIDNEKEVSYYEMRWRRT